MMRPVSVSRTCGSFNGACQRRTHELGFFACERVEQPRHHLWIGVVFEVGVPDGTQAIVRRGEDRRHDLARPRIVEAGEQNEGAEADVPVGVAGNCFEERRHDRARGSTADHAGGRAAHAVVDGPELADCGLQLLRGDRCLVLLLAALPRRRRCLPRRGRCLPRCEDRGAEVQGSRDYDYADSVHDVSRPP
jgi:hypothetical protein